jgi:hypothetical protein
LLIDAFAVRLKVLPPWEHEVISVARRTAVVFTPAFMGHMQDGFGHPGEASRYVLQAICTNLADLSRQMHPVDLDFMDTSKYQSSGWNTSSALHDHGESQSLFNRAGQLTSAGQGSTTRFTLKGPSCTQGDYLFALVLAVVLRNIS